MSDVPAPTSPASSKGLSQRLARLGIRRRRRNRSGPSLAGVSRTVLWVAPLTLLIWVWAQDQQIDQRQTGGLTFELEPAEGYYVTVLAAGRSPGSVVGDDAVSVSLTLRGPRAGLTRVMRALRDETSQVRQIAINEEPGANIAVDLQQMIESSPLVAELLGDAGVSIVEVAPAAADVQIEGIDTVPATPTLPDAITAQLAQPPTFDPPEVQFIGPSSALESLGLNTGSVTLDFNQAVKGGDNSATLQVLLPEDAMAMGVRAVPDAVRVNYTGKDAAIETYTIDALAIHVEKVAQAEREYRVEVEQFEVKNIDVRGPAATIAAIKESPDQFVRAILIMTGDDRFADRRIEHERPLEVRLPDDITLVSELPTVTYWLRDVEDPA